MHNAKELKGRISSIQRMSLHDGPGIRTTVFFKGCNLRCFWCHNPESWLYQKELQYFPDRCIGCGNCVPVCAFSEHVIDSLTLKHTFLRHSCIHCGKCAEVCPSGSLVMAGADWNAQELVDEVLRDKPFFDNSSGGVTISGGEPLIQFEFATNFLQLLKVNAINTAIESAFSVPYEIIESIRPYVDLFLIDLKHPDSAKHRKYTGSDNTLIIENIYLLDKTNSRYCIRIPIIPGINDDVETMRKIDLLLNKLKNLSHIEFMPYHAYGINKFISLGYDVSTQKHMLPPTIEKLISLAKSIRCSPVEFRSGPKTIRIENGGVTCGNQH